MKKQKNNSKKIPRWLKKVQKNSWEPEILLSGFVLIGLFQLPDKINNLSVYMRAELLQGNMNGAFLALQQAVYILIFGLIIHLFLRSVWVGLIGLSYTFPGGIKPENLNFQPAFKEKTKNLPPLEDQIIRLEKICSSIFASCFFLMMLIIGTILGTIVFFAFFIAIERIMVYFFSFSIFSLLDPFIDMILLTIIFIIMLDFAFIGLFRRNKIISRLYYPIYRLIGWITLSSTYKTIYYLFAANIKKAYLIAFFILFAIATVVGQIGLQKAMDESPLSRIYFYERIAGLSLFSGYFKDRNDIWSSYVMELPQPVIKGRYLEVILKHQSVFENRIKELCDFEQKSLTTEKDKIPQLKLDCLKTFYEIRIDGEIIDNIDWMFYFHQKEKRKGIISYLDLAELSSGKHTIEVYALFEQPYKIANSFFYKE
ncbi:MAG: hypothetical protein JJU28_10500 [Cyclobacteriaceae bacterium]|nr:hypothetical protein [Cyclobacteriaceae bacterium]